MRKLVVKERMYQRTAGRNSVLNESLMRERVRNIYHELARALRIHLLLLSKLYNPNHIEQYTCLL